MTGVGERRIDPERPARSVSCRVCYSWVEVLPERIDATPMYSYYRCQQCDCSFTIRRVDVEALRSEGAL